MAVSSGAWRSTSRSAANRSTTSQSSSRRSRSRATAGRDDHRARRPRRHFRARPRARGPRSRGRPRVDRRVRSVFDRRDERAREDRRLERSSPDRSRSGVPVGALPHRAGRSRRDRDPAGSRRDERRIRAHVRIPLCRVCCRPLEGQARAGVSRTARADALRRAGDRHRRVPRDRARPIGTDRDVTSTEISYGKAHVVFYRLGGRDIAPLAASVDIDVFGKRFLTAYTEGDNRKVVATDTMKNFVYAMAAEYTGSTLLGLCAFLGRRFIETYPVMEALRVSAREVPLDAAAGERGPSDVLFRSSRADHAVAQVAVDAVGGKAENHTPDHVHDGAGGVKIFAEPKATFGKIGLVLKR